MILSFCQHYLHCKKKMWIACQTIIQHFPFPESLLLTLSDVNPYKIKFLSFLIIAPNLASPSQSGHSYSLVHGYFHWDPSEQLLWIALKIFHICNYHSEGHCEIFRRHKKTYTFICVPQNISYSLGHVEDYL